MQVEEDPSSQFVDFTNATAAEQFVSDVEQALIGWQLANKGHASLAAGAAVCSKELQFLAPSGRTGERTYTLTLFQGPPGPEPPQRKGKRWQRGLEHFTPTMLSVADASRDFHWGAQLDADEGARPPYYAPALEDDGAPVFSRREAFKKVQAWFGVDGFLLLSRSSPREKTKQKQQLGSARGMEDGGESTEDLTEQEEREGEQVDGAQEGGDTTDEDALADIQVDQNEAGMLLSALTMALNNCNCTIPAFVPVFEPSRGTWIGSAVPGTTGNVSMAFDTDSVPELNPNQSCISGLLDFFKAKLQLPPYVEEKCRVEADELGDLEIGILVSASFGYSWERVDDPREAVTSHNLLAWRALESQLPTKDQHQIRQVTANLFGDNHPAPLLGASTSPLTGMNLKVSWPQLREGTYVDNVVHSTLDPISAPDWMLAVRFQELISENQRKPQLQLSKQIANLVQVYSNSRELSKDILVSELAPPMPVAPSPAAHTGTGANLSGEGTATHLSQSMPESTIPAARAAVVLGNAISSLVSAATWKGSDAEEIRRIVSELFDEEGYSSGENGDLNSRSGLPFVSMPSSVEHGAPLGELVSILATRMGQLRTFTLCVGKAHGNYVLLTACLMKRRWDQLDVAPLGRICESVEGAMVSKAVASFHELQLAFFRCDVSTGFRCDAVASARLSPLPPPSKAPIAKLLHSKVVALDSLSQHIMWLIDEKPVLAVYKHFRAAQESRPVLSSDDGIKASYNAQQSTLTKEVDNQITKLSGSNESEGETNDYQSDDEFFDSVEQQDIPLPSPNRVTGGPEGVLREASGVVCLQSNEPLLEPLTQKAVPMTEDIAKQQQDLLTRLGVTVESDKLRQQIQSTSLVSDMQSFKAANPRSCLADFIRWYSPKDWIPFKTPVDPLKTDLPSEGSGVWWFEKHGMLSERMRFGPGHEHLWQQMWETSAPVPAHRQKRLFDPMQESEKVYHYMETLSPHELFHQILAGAISTSVFAVETALPVRASTQTLPVVHRAMQTLRSHGNRAITLLDEALAESQVAFPTAGRNNRRGNSKEEPTAAVNQDKQLQVAFEMALDACWRFVFSLEAAEALISKALALLHYFPVSKDDQGSLSLVNLLLLSSPSYRQQLEMSKLLKQDCLRQQVAAIVLTNPTLAEAGPKTIPVQREYVLRCICPRPFLREYYGDSAVDGEDCEMSLLQPEEELEESPLVVCRIGFPINKWYEDIWVVYVASEFQLLLVSSWGDLTLRIIFALSMISNMNNMKKILSAKSPKRGQSKSVLQLTTVVPLYPNRRDVSDARTQSKLDIIVTSESRFTQALFFVWGAAILVLHLFAESVPGLPQCRMQVKPWLTSEPSCSFLVLDCYESHFSGKEPEVAPQWSVFNAKTTVRTVIRHCPQLEMPDLLNRFSQLKVLKVYNSTVVEWPKSAALSQKYHPNLMMLYLVRVNLTNGELPEGLLSNDFPHMLTDIEFCATNLRTLPEDFDLKWPQSASIYFEANDFTEVPAALARLAPYDLSLAMNPISIIPAAVFEGQVRFLHIGGTLFSELPKIVPVVSTSLVLRVDNTNLTFFWDWIDPVVESAHTLHINTYPILATNSPYCTDLQRIYDGDLTGFSAPFYESQSQILSNASEDNWPSLKAAVSCDPWPKTWYRIEFEDAYSGLKLV
ncbi:unnamed protein product [Phytophthora fragariaefolia]|uniref:Rab3 GTPase-activating protein catalytic subunit n=1 Tax=Phytophthora fragariaefolia TaxID=1490495 RepID=A0A9W7CX40_9STRA|nr:unnamed protein product [Phytophthora fragariaefolia]